MPPVQEIQKHQKRQREGIFEKPGGKIGGSKTRIKPKQYKQDAIHQYNYGIGEGKMARSAFCFIRHIG